MKKIILGVAVASAFAGAAGTASAQQVYGDVARVISANPIYERGYGTRRECRTEQVTGYEERRSGRPAPEEYRGSGDSGGGSGAGAVIGAIIGGVIGHQFGMSSAGRDHGTAAGAIIGGLVGSQAGRDSDSGYQRASNDVAVERMPVTRDVQRCSDVADERDGIAGYDVRYEYNGREFRTRMPYDPGPQIPVNVEVRPPASSLPPSGPRTPAYRGPY
jgi:uncharacterized protein YcfJ